MFLSDLSIKRPIFILMVLSSILLFGLMAFRNLGVDLYPKVEFPVMTVISVLPSADPKTVEAVVTEPIEETVSAIDSIKNIRSVSAEGISQVIIEFDMKKDIDVAYQEVQSKLAPLRFQLPRDLYGPLIEKFDLDSAPILTLIVSGDLPIGELTSLVDKEIKQPLKRIPKIGKIKVAGDRERKIWLWLDRDRLDANHITIQDIEGAIYSQHLSLPGGRITRGDSELILKTKGELVNPEQFEDLAVGAHNGKIIRFRDIGHVEIGLGEERSAAYLNGKSAIALLIGRQSGANSVEVANHIKEVVSNLKDSLQEKNIRLDFAQDNSTFILNSVKEVRFHLIFGGGLTILIVLLFLRNLRSTFVCALALPTAVIATFAFMAFMGFSQNMMTLLALSLAIGLLIDDAIVVQENIIRHIEEGKPTPTAASFGCREIALAVFATTLSIVAVFIPVTFMEGIVGRFFFQFGLTVSFAVLISMFVSFTLNPLFSAKLLKKPKKGKLYLLFEAFFKGLEKKYASLIVFSLKHKILIVSIALASFVGAMGFASFLRFEFIPFEDQSEFSVSIKAPQGSSLSYTAELVKKVEKKLEGQPWVDYVFSTVGADELHSVNKGSIYVKMLEKNKRTFSQLNAMELIRRELSDMKGGEITVEAIQRMAAGGEKTADIQFEIRGTSLEQLEKIANSITHKLKNTKGYLDVCTSCETGKPQAIISINREMAANYGVTPYIIASTIKAAFGGSDIATFKTEGEHYNVTLRFSEPFRKQIDQIGQITVKNLRGDFVPLKDLIEVQEEKGPTQIDHFNRVREITVYSNLDRNEKVLGEAIKEINALFLKEELPAGYSYGFVGSAANFKESFIYMLFALLLAVGLVYMVLAAQFESFLHPFTIMLTLPLSLVGAVGALVMFHMTMSIFTMVGMIMLMGLVTKNGILLIDFIKTLVQKDKMERKEAIVLAGMQRLRPILMTTLAIIFGMLPIAIGQGAGSESRSPMAVAVIGGLITSTLLTLVVIPVVYQIFEEWREKRQAFFIRMRSIKVHPSGEKKPLAE